MATLLPTNKIRGLVSKKKKRFQEGGFDLDLSYITDNIIAMGFPSEKLEGMYRNPMSEVKKFLAELHPGSYKIYNLCSERRYDHKKFDGPVQEFPFDDHNPCSLAMILQFCIDVGEWLDKSVGNVAVIHCKAGKGRTGLMICCYLQYSRRCQGATEALQLFAANRTMNKKGVTLHSQRRYVKYFESIAIQKALPTPTNVRLERIRMHTIPVYKKGGSEPWFSIFKGGNTIYYSDPIKGKKGNQVVDFTCGTILTNDIKIEFYHKDLKGKMFYFWFHTSYIKNNYFCLRKRDLELASKDLACKHFGKAFKVELYFKPKDGDAENHLATSEMGSCAICNDVVIADDSSVILDDLLYHWRCVTCDKCGKTMNGSKNCIIKEGKAVCERCEGDNFFTPCNACFRPLTAQRNVEVDNSSWHVDCFRCSYCNVLLSHKRPSSFIVEGGDVFCPEHKGMRVGHNKCVSPACPNPNRDLDMIAMFGGHFHPTCFSCIECGRTLHHKEDNYSNMDGLPCCSSHDEPIHCYGCSMPLSTNKAVTAFNEQWHADCLSCTEPNCAETWNSSTVEKKAEMKQGRIICVEHGFVSCQECKKRIPPPDLLEWDNKLLHRACFTCGICNQMIPTPNDPTSYFLSNGKPNCVKHQQKCARCLNVIQPGQLIEAKNRKWHRTCFTCQFQSCKKPLEHGQFVIVKGKNYCSSHPQCNRCLTPVRENDKYEDQNGVFHMACYQCASCHAPLDPENSAFLGNRLLCKNCHPAPVCARCDKILDQGHLAVGSQHYHEGCFTCTQCDALFSSSKDPIVLNANGLPICKNCVAPEFICFHCQNGIFEKVLNALGRHYHPNCFTCENCCCVLSSSYAMLDDHVFCRDCSSIIQRTNCEACHKLLIGKYVIVQGHKYHQMCVTCNGCSATIRLRDHAATANGTTVTCGTCSTPKSLAPVAVPSLSETIPKKKAFHKAETPKNPISDPRFSISKPRASSNFSAVRPRMLGKEQRTASVSTPGDHRSASPKK